MEGPASASAPQTPSGAIRKSMKSDSDSISMALLRAVGTPESGAKIGEGGSTVLLTPSLSSSSIIKLAQPSFETMRGGLTGTASTVSGVWRAKVNKQLTRLQSPPKKGGAGGAGGHNQDSIDGRIGEVHRIPRTNPFGARGSNLSMGAVPPLPADRTNGRPPDFINTGKRADLTRSKAFLARELNAMDSGTFMDDLTRTNCPVCSTISADTCSFCLKTKLSKVPRMHLKELSDRLLKETPSMTMQEMVKALHDYGRSSDVAAAVNERLHFGGYTASEDSRLYCARHQDAWSDLEDYAASMELEVRRAGKW